ncbi:Sphingomyelin phosphodiesterase [Pelomyxa schiedti]|nr:Sphingomyelin phosphodiesterase [Pelomyxa schiedti]
MPGRHPSSPPSSPVALLLSFVLLPLLRLAAGAQFWQFSDTHLDPDYVAGSAAVCKQLQCCQQHSIPSDGYENVTAGRWGAFKCHLPLAAWEEALSFVAGDGSDDSFILWTMDSTGSQIAKQTVLRTLETIEEAVITFQQAMPDRRVFPCVGNHDYHPLTMWAPPPDCDWMLSNITALWRYWLPDDALVTVRKGAYYTVLVEPGLRLVTMNTNWFDWWDEYANRTDENWDPAGQWQWLDDTLTQARVDGEKVILFGHHHPGIVWDSKLPDTIPSWEVRMLNLYHTYSDVIVARLAGHAHRDDLRLVYTTDTDQEVAYISPSLTTLTDVFPSVRRYKYDDTSKEILDWDQFYYDPYESEDAGEVIWHKLYSPLEYYGMKDLSPSSWADVLSLVQSDCGEFQRMWLIFNQGNPDATPCECGTECWVESLCSKTTAIYDDYQACVDSGFGKH